MAQGLLKYEEANKQHSNKFEGSFKDFVGL